MPFLPEGAHRPRRFPERRRLRGNCRSLFRIAPNAQLATGLVVAACECCQGRKAERANAWTQSVTMWGARLATSTWREPWAEAAQPRDVFPREGCGAVEHDTHHQLARQDHIDDFQTPDSHGQPLGFWGSVRVNKRPEKHGSTLEVTSGQISSQSPTDATRFWWHLYGS